MRRPSGWTASTSSAIRGGACWPWNESLVLESSPASIPQWIAEANRLRAELPPDVQETLRKHEEAATTDDPAYEEAMLVFYRRHVCRLDPWPDYVNRTFTQLEENPEVYHTMNGPSEFHVVGTLRDWDITNRLAGSGTSGSRRW